LLFRLRAVNETELLSDLGSALPDTRTQRDTAQTLMGDDLAALFGLDMEERNALVPSRRADSTSGDPRKKTRKRVTEKLDVAAAPAGEAKANAVKPAQKKKADSDKQRHRPTAKTSAKAMSARATQKNTMAPTRSAAKKTVATSSKSAATPGTAKASTGIGKPEAKATVSPRRRSDPIP
jgi:hypothetical protein